MHNWRIRCFGEFCGKVQRNIGYMSLCLLLKVGPGQDKIPLSFFRTIKIRFLSCRQLLQEDVGSKLKHA